MLNSLISDVDTRILVCLRPQADAIHSHYLQTVKEDYKIPHIERYVRDEISSGRWHYRNKIKDCVIFGRENLVVRLRDRDQILDADFVEDFRSALGIREDLWVGANESGSAASNSFLGPKSYAAVRYTIDLPHGCSCPFSVTLEREGEWRSTAFEVLGLVLDKLSWNDAPLNLLTADLTARYDAAFRKENVAVTRDDLGREDSRLFTDRSGSIPTTEAPELTREDGLRTVGGVLERIEHREGDDTAACVTVGDIKDERRIEQWRNAIHSKLKKYLSAGRILGRTLISAVSRHCERSEAMQSAR